jgi:enoyl-CoA hydratase/carnithine racemase
VSDHLVLERRGAIATLLLNRAEKRNALDLDMWSRLPDLVLDVADDDALKVLVVRGAGRLAFSAGADIGEFDRSRTDAESARAYDDATQRAERAVARFPKPTIAMIHGFCLGGGAELALACDFRFADENARFGIPAARLGLVNSLTATKALTDLAGPAVARHVLFTGLPLDARQAHAAGLFDRLHDPDDLEAATQAFAETLCALSQYALRSSKAILQRIAAGQVEDDDVTRKLRHDAFTGADYAEGVRAFLDKRPPVFE